MRRTWQAMWTCAAFAAALLAAVATWASAEGSGVPPAPNAKISTVTTGGAKPPLVGTPPSGTPTSVRTEKPAQSAKDLHAQVHSQPSPAPHPSLESEIAHFLSELAGEDFGISISVLAALGFTLIAVYPVRIFCSRDWRTRKADIFGSFTDKAKVLYLRNILKIKLDPDDKKATDQAAEMFEELYEERYGISRFAVPLRLYELALLGTMFLVSEAALKGIDAGGPAAAMLFGHKLGFAPAIEIPPVVAAGIAGAYLWIVADMIARARRLDLTSSDVLGATLRLVMAAAISTFIVQIANPAVALPVAFALGAFPLDTVRTILRRIASDKLGLGVGLDDNADDQVFKLDSVDHPIAERLLDANISTIAELAGVDPVQLCMRTGLSFDFVTDIVSQALARVYFGDRMDALRAAGLRGAMEIRSFLGSLQSQDHAILSLATALLESIPSLLPNAKSPPDPALRLEKAQFLNACDQIANDPNTEFLVEIWHDGDKDDAAIIPDYTKLLVNAGAA